MKMNNEDLIKQQKDLIKDSIKTVETPVVNNIENVNDTEVVEEYANGISPGMDYQWVKGENFGIVEKVKDNDGEFIYFESGKQIFLKVFNEFLLPIENGINPVSESTINNNTIVDLPINKPKYSESVNAIITTLNKSVKKNSNSFKFSLELENMPNKDVISMLYNVFEEKDVTEALEVYLNDQLQNIVKIISEQINEQIKA